MRYISSVSSFSLNHLINHELSRQYEHHRSRIQAINQRPLQSNVISAEQHRRSRYMKRIKYISKSFKDKYYTRSKNMFDWKLVYSLIRIKTKSRSKSKNKFALHTTNNQHGKANPENNTSTNIKGNIKKEYPMLNNIEYLNRRQYPHPHIRKCDILRQYEIDKQNQRIESTLRKHTVNYRKYREQMNKYIEKYLELRQKLQKMPSRSNSECRLPRLGYSKIDLVHGEERTEKDWSEKEDGLALEEHSEQSRRMAQVKSRTYPRNSAIY